TLTTEEIFYQVLHFCVCALKVTSRFSLVRDDPIRGADNITRKDLQTASADQAMTGHGNDTSTCSRHDNPACNWQGIRTRADSRAGQVHLDPW
ncbi:MAG: hypothetical protein LIV24_04740, partial [Eubacterium sp.]|nr:hypothetical protein [Eubacterium sp.]